VVDVLFLDGCVVAEFAMEAAAVQPVDVLGDSDLEIVDAFPLATVTDQFGFEERVDYFRSINATIVLQPAAEEPPGPPLLGNLGEVANCNRDLHRTDLPPTPQAGQTRPVYPDRIRGHHEHDSRTRCVTKSRPQPVQQTQGIRQRSDLDDIQGERSQS